MLNLKIAKGIGLVTIVQDEKILLAGISYFS